MTEKPRKLRAAVIGVGHLGREHARLYSSFDDVDLVAVVDLDESRCREIAEARGARAVAGVRDLLGGGADGQLGIDLASVVVPTVAHREVSLPLLEAGIPLLVEKPLATDSVEARELCEVAREKGVVLQVGHVERFNPALRAAFNLVREPRYIVGDRLSPFPFRSTDIGVIMDLMIHDLDIVLELVKSPVSHIDSVGVPVLSKRTEDIANARIVFENGCVANLSASRVSVKRMRKLRLFQKDGYISIDFGARQVQVIRRAPDAIGEQMTPDALAALAGRPREELDALLFGSLLQVEQFSMDDGEEPLGVELKSFVQAVREGRAPEVSGEDGLRAIQAVESIRVTVDRYMAQELERAARSDDAAPA